MDDPGWQVTWRSVLGSLGPVRGARRTGELRVATLVALRQSYVSFLVASSAMTVVAVILGDVGRADPPVATACGIVAAFGVVALVASTAVARRLVCSSDEALAAGYRSRFFLRIALAEAPALFGLAVGMSLGPWWVYFVGLACSLVGMARAAPTRRQLESDQRRLTGEGCHRSLLAVLMRPMPSPTMR